MCTTPTFVSGRDGRSVTLPVVTAGLGATAGLAGSGALGLVAVFLGADVDGPFALGSGGETGKGPVAAGDDLEASADAGGSKAADAPEDAPRVDVEGVDVEGVDVAGDDGELGGDEVLACCAMPLAAGASASEAASSNRAQVMVVQHPEERSALRISAPLAPHTCVRGMSQ